MKINRVPDLPKVSPQLQRIVEWRYEKARTDYAFKDTVRHPVPVRGRKKRASTSLLKITQLFPTI